VIAATDVFMLIFRIIHIAAGVAWVGSVFFLATFVTPTAAAIAPAGAPFMMELLGKRKLVDRLLVLAGTTIVGGLVLYIRDMDDFGGFGNWISSSYGFVLTIGALAAITGFLIGLLGTRPAVLQMVALGQQIAQSEGPPPPELAAQMPPLQERLKGLARITLGLLTFSVLAMATARYW
jgi:hypothetical protein